MGGGPAKRFYFFGGYIYQRSVADVQGIVFSGIKGRTYLYVIVFENVEVPGNDKQAILFSCFAELLQFAGFFIIFLFANELQLIVKAGIVVFHELLYMEEFFFAIAGLRLGIAAKEEEQEEFEESHG